MALLELLRKLDPERFDISLFVLTAQGEMVSKLSAYVRLLNTDYNTNSVLSQVGKRKLLKHLLCSLCAHGTVVRHSPYLFRNLWDMFRRGSVNMEKQLWQSIRIFV